MKKEKRNKDIKYILITFKCLNNLELESDWL